MSYIDSLNEKQREAVLATEGPVSVLAGAGSGKTKVLTTRIYHLIREGIEPSRILAVTFTNKAAREMRERLGAMLGEGGPMPFTATFHGLGREILERYGRDYGIPRYFSVYDRDDSERAIKEALKELGMDPKEVSPRAILAKISKAKGQGLSREEYAEKEGRHGFLNQTAAVVWRLYEESLAREKAFDFDDLIVLPTRLLREHEALRKQVQDRFHYLHIDEYQDTNKLQGELVGLIAGSRRNVFVVGDIDQCIYTWRQATIENLLLFDETYPGAAHIVLEHNYRSTKTIVEASNAVIEKNRNRKEKQARTDNPQGSNIELHVLDTAEAEARFVANDARAHMYEGIPATGIAVLYRTNFQSRLLEEAFLRANVPYTLLGTKFLERREVKDIIAWVRLALDPAREADKVRAIQSPSRGIGKVSIAKLAVGDTASLSKGIREKIEVFEKTVTELHEESKKLAPSAFVKLVIERSGMEDTLQKGGEDDLERLENIKELVTLASRFDHMPGEEGISAFLAETALSGDQDELDRPAKKQRGEGVTLMTVHAAKGLEFDVVYVTGLEEGLFPHEGMGDGEERDEEEERRLFYVAMTRAKKQLVLSLARVRRVYGTDFIHEPSSFISDIDASLMTVEYGNNEPTIYI